MKRKQGQPTKYKKEYDELAEKHLSQGGSTDSVGAKFNVASSTVHLWINTHRSFSDAIKRGEAKRAEVIEKLLIHLAKGQPGNAAAAIFLATNWTSLKNQQYTNMSGEIKLPFVIKIEKNETKLLERGGENRQALPETI